MQIGGPPFAWLGLIVMAAGCGTTVPNQPKLVPVSGAVTLNGKPLAGATVEFVPTGSTHGTGAYGCTDKTGKYELSTTRGGKGRR